MSAPIKAQTSDDATHELWQVAEIGDVRQLLRLLSRGADVNARNEAGMTVLMVAAYLGRLEMVRALSEHGADLNATDREGLTAAMLADQENHQEIVRVLVARGVKKIPQSDVSKIPTPAPRFTQDERFDDLNDSDVSATDSNPEVRTLHEPPEIWDLVHESRVEFNPRSAFFGNITSMNHLVLIIMVLLVGGGAVFGFIKLRGVSGTDQAESTAPAPATVPAASINPGGSNPPVAASVSANAPVQTDEGATTTASSSPVTEPQTTTSASNQQPTSTSQIPDSNVNSNIPVAAPAVTAPDAATSVADSSVTAPPVPVRRVMGNRRRQKPLSSTTLGQAAVARPEEDKTQTSAPLGTKSGGDKDAVPTAAKKEEAPDPKVSSPATPSATPKPKVIQWP